jgi:hypothetical protein
MTLHTKASARSLEFERQLVAGGYRACRLGSVVTPNQGLELTASRCDVKIVRQEWS